jgi:hypothetical protein
LHANCVLSLSKFCCLICKGLKLMGLSICIGLSKMLRCSRRMELWKFIAVAYLFYYLRPSSRYYFLKIEFSNTCEVWTACASRVCFFPNVGEVNCSRHYYWSILLSKRYKIW